jgi:putative holliday junction resolvase
MPRIFAIDYGTDRVGTAVSDETATLARPVAVVPVRGPKQLARDLAEMIRQHEAAEIVLGLPLALDGGAGEHVPAVEDLARRLRGRLHLPVHLLDERFTTALAQRALVEAGQSSREQRQSIDAAAAAMLLQSYLDSRKRQARAASPQEDEG